MADSNTQKAIRALLTPAAPLEACMMAVLTQRSVDKAVGAQLTTIGKIVGRKSRDPDDEKERRLTRTQIVVNRSCGRIEDVLKVARGVVGDPAMTPVLDNIGGAAFILRIEGVTVGADAADDLASTIGKATSGGVGAYLVYTTGPIANEMRWGTGTWGQNWARARVAG